MTGLDPADPRLGLQIHPEPSDDEVVAILAAYERLWPAAPDTSRAEIDSTWRFGRRSWQPRARWAGWHR